MIGEFVLLLFRIRCARWWRALVLRRLSWRPATQVFEYPADDVRIFDQRDYPHRPPAVRVQVSEADRRRLGITEAPPRLVDTEARGERSGRESADRIEQTQIGRAERCARARRRSLGMANRGEFNPLRSAGETFRIN